MFSRYTERARRAIFFARYEASQTRWKEIDTDHILLGILREAKGFISLIGVRDRPAMQLAVRKHAEAGATEKRAIATSVDMALTVNSRFVLEKASKEAERYRESRTGVEHLLLALCMQPTETAELMANHGVTETAIRSAIERYGLEVGQPAQRVAEQLTKDCIEFLDSATGERIGITDLQATADIPSVGDIIAFGAQSYAVVDVHFHYEQPVKDLSTGKLVRARICMRPIRTGRSSQFDHDAT